MLLVHYDRSPVPSQSYATIPANLLRIPCSHTIMSFFLKNMDWQHLFKEYNEEDDSDYEDNRNHNRVQETYVVPPNNGVNGEYSKDSVENRVYSLHLETKTNYYFLSRLILQKLSIRIVSHLKQALEI